jgi:hypothetical protein
VAEVQAIIASVRERGYAENTEESAEGPYTASVPIVNDDVALTTLRRCLVDLAPAPGQDRRPRRLR